MKHQASVFILIALDICVVGLFTWYFFEVFLLNSISS